MLKEPASYQLDTIQCIYPMDRYSKWSASCSIRNFLGSMESQLSVLEIAFRLSLELKDGLNSSAGALNGRSLMGPA